MFGLDLGWLGKYGGLYWRNMTSIVAVGLVAAVMIAACSQGTSVSPTALPSSPTALPNSPIPSPSTAACPNPEGGECLGPLTAGTYATTEFQAGVTYTVPDGWANYEDLPGNFLLVPPSGTLEGVNAGTSDYIGMYDGIAPASANCEEVPEPGIESTPEAMADWYVSLPGLDTTEPTPVDLGGLMGRVFDVALAEGHKEGCPFPGVEDIPMFPLIIGVGPASLHHVVCCDITTRLYLLSGPSDETIAIEVSDVEGGETLQELEAVVRSFEFE